MSLGLRLVSDGTPTGTQLITPDGWVFPTKRIRFRHDAGEPPITTVEIELIGVEFDAGPKPLPKSPEWADPREGKVEVAR